MNRNFYHDTKRLASTLFQFDKIYPTKAAMEEDLYNGTDKIYQGRCVLVEYGEQYIQERNEQGELVWDIIEQTNNQGEIVQVQIPHVIENPEFRLNFTTDQEIYGTTYDSTVWQKIFTTNHGIQPINDNEENYKKINKFIMIAELNSIMPKLEFIGDKAEIYFQANENNVDDDIYDIFNTNAEDTAREQIFPWFDQYTDKELRYLMHYPTPIRLNVRTKNLDYNAVGFSIAYASPPDPGEPYMHWLTNDFYAKNYEGKHNKTPITPPARIEEKTFKMHLPSFGNLINDLYCLIYGRPSYWYDEYGNLKLDENGCPMFEPVLNGDGTPMIDEDGNYLFDTLRPFFKPYRDAFPYIMDIKAEPTMETEIIRTPWNDYMDNYYWLNFVPSIEEIMAENKNNFIKEIFENLEATVNPLTGEIKYWIQSDWTLEKYKLKNKNEPIITNKPEIVTYDSQTEYQDLNILFENHHETAKTRQSWLMGTNSIKDALSQIELKIPYDFQGLISEPNIIKDPSIEEPYMQNYEFYIQEEQQQPYEPGHWLLDRLNWLLKKSSYLYDIDIVTCNNACEGACLNACTSCTDTCERTCGGACAGVCSDDCDITCELTCTAGCSGTCTNKCKNTCTSACGGNCKEICTTTCKSGCKNECKGCTGTCDTSCEDGCYNGCGDSCVATCSATCSSSCTSDCSDTCSNSSTEEPAGGEPGGDEPGGDEPETCIIYFDANGGQGNTMSQLVEKNKSVTLNANQFTRPGYAFSRWNTRPNGTGTYYTDQAQLVVTDSSITLYAQWTPNSCSIIYDANGGINAPEPQYWNFGDINSITLRTSEPTRTGYVFSSWNTKQDGSGTLYDPGEEILIESTGVVNMILYAQWIQAQEQNTFVLTFDGDGGSNVPSSQSITTTAQSYTFNISNTQPTKSGYQFMGWEDQVAAELYAPGDTITIRAGRPNVTLTAGWALTYTYSLLYNANGGNSVPNAQDYTGVSNSHTFQISSTLPTHSNSAYIFDEWNTDIYGGGDSYNPGDSITIQANGNNTSVILFAQWVEELEELPEPTTASIAFSYDLAGGSGNFPTTIYTGDIGEMGSYSIISEEPTYPGNNFSCWSCSDGELYNSGDTVNFMYGDSNYNFTAIWIPEDEFPDPDDLIDE